MRNTPEETSMRFVGLECGFWNDNEIRIPAKIKLD